MKTFFIVLGLYILTYLLAILIINLVDKGLERGDRLGSPDKYAVALLGPILVIAILIMQLGRHRNDGKLSKEEKKTKRTL